MSLRTRIQAKFVQALSKGLTPAEVFNYNGTTPYYGDSQQETYQDVYATHAAVYRCVTVLSQNLAKLPFVIWEYDAQGNKKFVTHESQFDLLRFYNPWQTYFDFWEQVKGFLELNGEAPIYLQRNKGQIRWMFPIRPDKITIVPDERRMISHYEFQSGTDRFKIPAKDMLFLKYFNPDNDFRGLAPLRATEKDLEIDYRVMDVNNNMIAQSARPSGVISTEQNLGDAQWERYQEKIKGKYMGELNRGKVLFMDAGMKWQQVGLSTQDMEYMAQRKWTKNQVMSIFGVPPIYLMQFEETSILQNAEAQYKLLWTATLIPQAVKLAQTVSKYLIPAITGIENRYTFEFDFSKIPALQKDKTKLSEQFERGAMIGATTPNDFREHVLELERDPNPKLDLHYIPLNMGVMEYIDPDAGNEAEPPKEVTNILTLLDSVEKLMGTTPETYINKCRDVDNQIKKSMAESKINTLRHEAELTHSLTCKKFETKFIDVVTDSLIGQEKEVLDNLKRRKSGRSGTLTKELTQDMLELLNFDLEKWVRYYEVNGEPLIAQALVFAAVELATGLQGSFVPSIFAQNYIQSRSHEYAGMVAGSTYKDVNRILEAAVEAGTEIAVVIDQITEFFVDQRAFRGELVARTELVSAANAGRFEGMSQTGVKYHTWYTQRDANVRDAHQHLEGITVKVGEAFPVGGTYGGDPRFPSDYNERCYTVPAQKPTE